MANDQRDSLSDLVLKPVEISVDIPDKDDKTNKGGLKINRLFTQAGQDPYRDIVWEKRSSVITDEKGAVISNIVDLEIPSTWTQLATDILAYKYLRKAGLSTKEGRETSAKQAVKRVAHSIADFGQKFGYFSTAEDRSAFEDELTHLLITQKAAFNSPVWFNVGLYHQYGIEGQGGAFYWDFKKNRVLETKTAYRNPQCSACFILSVRDSLPSIFEQIKTESHIFKYGSGTGSNFSSLRSRFERLSGGGYSSGMMSFLRVFDRGAGATKSGGTTRRAAKMVVVNIDHPEIEEFIEWKVREEEKAQALIAAGYESDFNGEAYLTVSGQNANNSVRVTDEFMKAVENDAEWQTRMVITKEPYKTYKARDLMDKIAQAAWRCADPGLQFDTTINNWHTCPNTGRINASNPCSEYLFLDDSACNLASINLVKFLKEDGTFDIDGYRQAVRTMFIGQEIIVDFSSYPTDVVAQNSHDYRPLGLGYANLGTLLMIQGIPYDSDKARAIAAALTAVMNGHAYKTSAEIAAVKGTFAGFVKNRAPMLEVMKKHRAASYKIDEKACPHDILEAAHQDCDEAVALGEQFGYRNAQATLLAPTGTIGLLMDCDTTGVEPDFALVKYKKLAGGGSMKIVNQAVQKALSNLGYTFEQQEEILKYALGTGSLSGPTAINRQSLMAKGLTEQDLDNIEKHLSTAFTLELAFNPFALGEGAFARLGVSQAEAAQGGFSLLQKLGFSEAEISSSDEVICGTSMLEGAPHLKEEHYPVFDCANKCGAKGTRYLAAMSHVKMMAAVQPFLSGAISKTINLPSHATVEDVKEVYMQSWKLGLKAIALYRDGSKLSQPLNTQGKKDKEETTDKPQVVTVPGVKRRRLPDERQAVTHKFQIAGHKGYVTVGLFEDGQPGEIFITIAKEGSLISGLMDSLALSFSLALQYGVPLSVLVKKFSHTRFEPSGFTRNPQIRIAKSIVDYIARYLGLRFLSTEEQLEAGIAAESMVSSGQAEINFNLNKEEVAATPAESSPAETVGIEVETKSESSNAPICANCGSLMRMKTGSCYTCQNCGNTSGGCG